MARGKVTRAETQRRRGVAACPHAAEGGVLATKTSLTGLTRFTGFKEGANDHVNPLKTKLSGVEWLGDIPEGWEVVPIRYYIDYSFSGVWGSEANVEQRTITCYRIADFDYARGTLKHGPLTARSYSELEIEGKLVSYGDLLLEKSGGGDASPVGRVIFVDRCDCATCSNFIQQMRCKALGVGKYLYYIFHALYSRQVNGLYYNQTIGIQNLKVSKYLSVKVPLPPLPEQRAIADYLDEKCGAIDAAIAEAKKGIEEYKAWKISLIDDVVCNGIVRHKCRKETGEVWLTDIPDEWELTQIRYLFALRDERNDKPLKDVNLISLYTDKGVVQHADLEKTTGNKASTADGYKLVYENDIVVNIILCWMGAVGRSAYNGVTSPAYDVYRPINPTKVLSRYYHYLFRTPRFNGKCYEEGRGIMMMRWRTYSSEFRAIKVPVPPTNEQQAIADYLDDKCAAIDAMVAEKESLIADLEAYKKSLIYETVTGKREVG